MRRTAAWPFVSGMLLALGSMSAHATATTYSWEKEVRPAIDAAFCVTGADVKGHYRFWAITTGGEKCPIKATDPALAAVTKAVNKSNASIQWLFIATMEKLSPKDRSADPASKDSVEAAFLKAVREDSRLVTRYMPLVHAALKSADASCADCPGPVEADATPTVTLDQLLPYAVRYVWPDRLQGPSVSLHICMGANGISEMPNADLRLADAAFWGVFGNKDVMPSIQKHLSSPDAFPNAKTDDERLALIRSALHEGLAKVAAFRTAFAKGLVQNAGKLPVVCSDCAAAGAAAGH